MNRILLILLVVFGVVACQPNTIKQTKSIIVYGSNNCDHCVDFKKALDSVGFTYDFKDVEFNEALANEMVYKVQQARISRNISYPVIDVEGKVLVAPKLIEVLDLM